MVQSCVPEGISSIATSGIPIFDLGLMELSDHMISSCPDKNCYGAGMCTRRRMWSSLCLQRS